MTHARQQIREAVATILSRSPIAWKTVLKQRKEPDRVLWPYLMVHTPSDDPVAASVNSSSVQLFACDLLIEGRLRLPGNGDMATIEEQFDAMGTEIQTKLTFPALLAQIPGIKSLSPPRTNTDVLPDEDDVYFGQIVLSYTVGYAILEGIPGTLI
jgi:hypothetical protein